MNFRRLVSAVAALAVAGTMCAGLAVTASADDGTTTVTLTSKTSAYSDGSTITTATSEDPPKAYYSQFRDWGSSDGTMNFRKDNYGSTPYIALYSFDISGLSGAVSSATFTATLSGTGDSKYAFNIRLLGYNGTLDTLSNSTGTILGTVTDTGSFQPLDDNLTTTTDSRVTYSTGTTFPVSIESKATTYVTSAVEAGEDTVIFAVAANMTRLANFKTEATLSVTTVDTSTSKLVTVPVSYISGTTDLSGASALSSYPTSYEQYTNTSLTPSYPDAFEYNGCVYRYESGGDEITVAEDSEIVINYTEITMPTAPTAQTTGSEAEYTSYSDYIDTTYISDSGTITPSTLSLGDTFVVEFDTYVTEDSNLVIKYAGKNATGPALRLRADEEKTYIEYDTSGTYYNINTTDAAYTTGTWAHVQSVCTIVEPTDGTENILKLEPLTVTVTPSSGTTEWSDTLTNNRSIAGRNLAPSYNSSYTFSYLTISASGVSFVANFVTYSLPNITAVEVATTDTLPDDIASTLTYVSGDVTTDLPEAGETVTTYTIKVTNGTSTDFPTLVTPTDGAESLTPTVVEGVTYGISNDDGYTFIIQTINIDQATEATLENGSSYTIATTTTTE